MRCKDLINIMDNLAPKYLIEEWDNCGFEIGSKEKDISNVLITLDIRHEVVQYAIDNNIDMIISHHPLFFNSIKNISKDSIKGNMIYDIINNDIVIFSAHTNLDNAYRGINYVLGNLFNLKEPQVINPVYKEKLYKIVVFVPKTHSNHVRNAMSSEGAGHIGNYSHCTYNTEGIGTFMPREGTNPYIGEKDKLEEVEEVKIETIVEKDKLNKTIEAMIQSHPYEEVAYDVYKLENENIIHGTGRVGDIDSISLRDLCEIVKDKLGCKSIRVYGDLERKVKRLAVSGGSGSGFIKSASSKEADVYITSEIDYHDGQLAKDLGLAIIDANHYDTEKVVLNHVKEYLLAKTNNELNVLVFDKNVDEFIVI
ncbi:Nif3-like dinuclear metal center hexameric protein [Dethiothermospora halolimnae]|uniref:Nif3-like dinuclear metal center hexameric protein n=1 Tax=Dethiothermospora halolimnae TaxID=3114390 RepID=UPI003CCC02C8